MDLNKIQSVLESLPDQDIAKYAQAPSAQVPQVLAQMELQRRATLRQAAQMKGGRGMFAGGAVRRFEKGGLTSMQENFNKRQAREDAILEEAKRKRGEQMKENGGIFSAVANGISSLLGAAKGAIADDRAAFALEQGATDFQKGKVPPTPVPPVQDAPQTLPPTPKGSAPNADSPVVGVAPSGGKPVVSLEDKGLATLAPMQQPLDPNADPRMAQFQELLKQKGAVATKAYIDEMSLRKNAMVPVDEEKERNRQLYTALGQWGSALLLSRSYGVANAAAINTLQNELAKSEEKREAFKKASLDIALAEIKNRLEQANAPIENFKAFEALRTSILKEGMDKQEQDRKNRDTEADIKFKEGSLRVAEKNAESNRIIANKRDATGSTTKPLTYEEALKVAKDERAKNPMQTTSLEDRARQIMREDPARIGLNKNPVGGMPDPAAIDAELARRGL